MATADRAKAWDELTDKMQVMIWDGLEALPMPLRPVVLPWHACPDKVLSRTTLDRYLPAGLAYLAGRLDEAKVLVR